MEVTDEVFQSCEVLDSSKLSCELDNIENEYSNECFNSITSSLREENLALTQRDTENNTELDVISDVMDKDIQNKDSKIIEYDKILNKLSKNKGKDPQIDQIINVIAIKKLFKKFKHKYPLICNIIQLGPSPRQVLSAWEKMEEEGVETAMEETVAVAVTENIAKLHEISKIDEQKMKESDFLPKTITVIEDNQTIKENGSQYEICPMVSKLPDGTTDYYYALLISSISNCRLLIPDG